MNGPVVARVSVDDLAELHQLAAPEGARMPPHSVRVSGRLLTRFLADHGAMYRRLSQLGMVTEPGEGAETP